MRGEGAIRRLTSATGKASGGPPLGSAPTLHRGNSLGHIEIMNGSTIVVAGATGNLGGRIVRAFAERGTSITANRGTGGFAFYQLLRFYQHCRVLFGFCLRSDLSHSISVA